MRGLRSEQLAGLAHRAGGAARLCRAGITGVVLALTVTFAAAREATAAAPAAIVASTDGATLYVGFGGSRSVGFAARDGTLRQQVSLPAPVSGLALSPDGSRLAATCAAAQSTVCIIDTTRAVVLARIPTRHSASAPVFSSDGRTLYVCNRFNHEVVVLDVANSRETARIAVEREPVAAALSRDGRRLFVANHLHATTADAEVVAASVSVIDTATHRVERHIRLPNGSGLLLGTAVSPDGRHVAVTHNLARFHVPTTQIERGWMNTAALTLIDATTLQVINTVLLDNVERGAANPWAVAWTLSGRHLLVTHAGTHELSVIDFPALLTRLEALPEKLPAGKLPDYTRAANTRSEVPNDLAFLTGVRRRVALAGNGPRSLALTGEEAWVPGYFSDSVDVVSLPGGGAPVRSHTWGPGAAASTVRRGEMLFNDATLCFQHWQSCASCHSYDARVDGLNWDLLNDGLGSTKNVKSLLLAHRTPPAMSTGVRRDASVAVRSGIRYILFASPAPEVPAAIDEYLKSLAPGASPQLEKGKLSAAGARGKKLFNDRKVGCVACHPAPLFTDLRSYDVGTRSASAGGRPALDTPTLIELWRTGPYLHDGSAGSLHDVLTRRNRDDRHGVTSHLTPQQIDDLAAYILSL